MIRFKGGKPKKAWLSQHSNGEAYAFGALEKNKDGNGLRVSIAPSVRSSSTDNLQPVLYIAKGSHAIYAREGQIDHTIPNFNTNLPFLLVDECQAGPKFDPLLASYVYSYNGTFRNAIPGQFAGLNASSPQPGWLYFNGHWGDQAYPATDARQQALAGFRRYVDGPTGPVSKQLDRKRVWPENSHASGQLVRTSLDGRTRFADQLREWWWRAFGGEKKAMKIRGSPKRVFADGTVAPSRPTGKEPLVLEEEKV